MPTMRVSLLLSLVLLSSQARADVVLSALFQDHLVLQRGRPVPIWGRADPGETLTVRFHRQTVSTTASADGRWIVYLEALEANGTEAELKVVYASHQWTSSSPAWVREVLSACGLCTVMEAGGGGMARVVARRA